MIKFSKHNIKNSHLKEITKIIKIGWLTTEKIQKFEEQFKNIQALNMRLQYQVVLQVYI